MSPIPPYASGFEPVIDGAPSALDTLNEIAAAIGDDATFAVTVAGQIAALDSRVDTLESAPSAGDVAIFETLNSAAWSGGSVLATNSIVDGDQNNEKKLTPTGSASWVSSITNPSSDPVVGDVRIKIPSLSLTPPVDGTDFYIRRVVIATVDGNTDVWAYTDRLTFEAAKGPVYVPGHELRVPVALTGGEVCAISLEDGLTLEWASPGNVTIYPQSPYIQAELHGRTDA